MDKTTTWNPPLMFDLDKVEGIAEEESKVTLNYTPPVMLPSEAELETNELLMAHEPDIAYTAAPQAHLDIAQLLGQKITPAPRVEVYATVSPWWWLVGSLGLLLGAMLLVDAYLFIATQYSYSWFLGTLFLGLISSVMAAVSVLTWRAYQNLQTLRTVSALQREGQRLMETNGYGDAIHYINRLAQFYTHRPDVRARLDRFYITLKDSHHDREICTLFSTNVMRELDQQAHRIVLQRSKETALMVMVSPIALLDVLVTLWRNVRLVRDIATLYGGRPGFLGSMSLMTAVLQNLIYADVSEVLADSLAETLGHSVLAVFSAQAAQGIGSGILTARVGLKAMAVCRPLPFVEEEKPRLKDIRREIMFSLKNVFEPKKKEGGKHPVAKK